MFQTVVTAVYIGVSDCSDSDCVHNNNNNNNNDFISIALFHVKHAQLR